MINLIVKENYFEYHFLNTFKFYILSIINLKKLDFYFSVITESARCFTIVSNASPGKVIDNSLQPGIIKFK